MKTSIVTDVYTLKGGAASGDYISQDEAQQAAEAAGDGIYTLTKATIISIEGSPPAVPTTPKAKFTPTPVLTSLAAMKKHDAEVKAKKEAAAKAEAAALNPPPVAAHAPLQAQSGAKPVVTK